MQTKGSVISKLEELDRSWRKCSRLCKESRLRGESTQPWGASVQVGKDWVQTKLCSKGDKTIGSGKIVIVLYREIYLTDIIFINNQDFLKAKMLFPNV